MKNTFKDPKALVSTIASLVSVPSTITIYTQSFPPIWGVIFTGASGISVIFLIVRLIQLDRISNKLRQNESKVALKFDPERQYRKNWVLLKNATYLDVVDTTGETVHCKFVITALCINSCSSFFLTTSPEEKIIGLQVGGNYKFEESRTGGQVKIYIKLDSPAEMNSTYNFEVKFTFKNAYTSAHEFFKHRKYYEVPQNEVYVMFHNDKLIKGYNVIREIDQTHSVPIEEGVNYKLVNGRSCLSVVTDKIALDDVLLLEWDW